MLPKSRRWRGRLVLDGSALQSPCRRGMKVPHCRPTFQLYFFTMSSFLPILLHSPLEAYRKVKASDILALLPLRMQFVGFKGRLQIWIFETPIATIQLPIFFVHPFFAFFFASPSLFSFQQLCHCISSDMNCT